MKEKTDKEFDSKAERIERTGPDTFNVHHDDGSIFECSGDPDVIGKLSRSNHPKETDSFPVGIGFDKNGRVIR